MFVWGSQKKWPTSPVWGIQPSHFGNHSGIYMDLSQHCNDQWDHHQNLLQLASRLLRRYVHHPGTSLAPSTATFHVSVGVPISTSDMSGMSGNGWFRMKIRMNTGDFGVSLFQQTSICHRIQSWHLLFYSLIWGAILHAGSRHQQPGEMRENPGVFPGS